MIFSKFNTDDVVAGRINQVSSGLFGTGSLFVSQSTFFTQSGVYGQASQLTGSNVYDIKNNELLFETINYFGTEEISNYNLNGFNVKLEMGRVLSNIKDFFKNISVYVFSSYLCFYIVVFYEH